MKKFFKIYFSYLLSYVVLIIVLLVIISSLKGLPLKDSLDTGSLAPFIGFLLMMPAFIAFLKLIPDFIRKMGEKNQRDIDEYKRLKSLSQEQNIGKH